MTHKLSEERMMWFRKWVDQECEQAGAERANVLLGAWRTWAQREIGAGAFFVRSHRSLGMALRQLGYRREHTMKGSLWLGLRLKSHSVSDHRTKTDTQEA